MNHILKTTVPIVHKITLLCLYFRLEIFWGVSFVLKLGDITGRFVNKHFFLMVMSDGVVKETRVRPGFPLVPILYLIHLN